MAEDVLEGVRLAIVALNSPGTHEKMVGRQRLEVTTRMLIKWLEGLPKTQCRPFIEVSRPYATYRLGRLLNGEYALYEGPATLSVSQKYPINYVYGHTPPHDNEKSDTIPGTEYQNQLYVGYAPPTINDMDGYAISLNQLLALEERREMHLGAEPAPGLPIPYYRGFPDPASTAPTKPW